MSSPVSVEHHGAVAVITIDHPPVNALSQAVRRTLMDALKAFEADANLKAAILICSGRTFIAGADINEFGKPPLEPYTADVMRAIADCSKPITAAMHGTVLGGGLEAALACHYRVALEPTKLGFPEVNLGLIPGAGGTQLMPRLAGVTLALEMITSGKPVAAGSGSGRKIVDKVIDGNDWDALKNGALTFAEGIVRGNDPVPRLADVQVPKQADHDAAFSDWREETARKRRGELAAQRCIDSIENAILLPFDDGIREERRLFAECRDSSQSRAMRYAFFAERRSAKVDGIDKAISPLPICEVGVVGAGTMGVGIAIAFADAGLPVTLLELDDDRLSGGLERIRSAYEKSVQRGRISSAECELRCAQVSGTTDYAGFSNVDLVVEAAFESMDVKREIFASLDGSCKPSAVLATNTSYLDVNRIANATGRPERVLGMHFFSPANIMKLVEIVRTDATSDAVLATALAVAKQLRKVAVTVGVCYGFVGNRMYARYGAEAQNLLLEGASPAQVDTTMRDWGMAMGPFEVADMSGLDIGVKAREYDPNPPDDPRFFAVAKALVAAGRLGRKSAAGYYDYASGSKKADDDVTDLIASIASQLGVSRRQSDASAIQKRIIAALIDEGNRVVAEGVVQRTSDIDVIWLNGYGFPRFRGGPMWFADNVDTAS